MSALTHTFYLCAYSRRRQWLARPYFTIVRRIGVVGSVKESGINLGLRSSLGKHVRSLSSVRATVSRNGPAKRHYEDIVGSK